MQTSVMTSQCLSSRVSLAGTRLSHSPAPLSAPRPALRLAPGRAVAFKDDDKTYTVPADSKLSPAFTRERERTVGRLASLGLAFAWAGEVITGLGPISQLARETGMPVAVSYASTAALIAIQLFGGLNNFGPTFDDANQSDVNKRTKGLTGITAIEPDVTDRIDPLREPGKFFLRNELVLGRFAMTAFFGAAVLEYVWGGESPLAHVGLITPGVPLSQAPWWLLGSGIVFFLNGIGTFSQFGQNKDSDTY